ncbi:hypothetical protein D9M68_984590 [compost metagenome]
MPLDRYTRIDLAENLMCPSSPADDSLLTADHSCICHLFGWNQLCGDIAIAHVFGEGCSHICLNYPSQLVETGVVHGWVSRVLEALRASGVMFYARRERG